ncbi:MAG: tetratricopeptide repeat protein [bacterium]
MGWVYDEKKLYTKAIFCFDKAIELDPEFAYAWNNKGVALYYLGKYWKARRCAKKVLEIDPDYENAKRLKQACNEKLWW